MRMNKRVHCNECGWIQDSDSECNNPDCKLYPSANTKKEVIKKSPLTIAAIILSILGFVLIWNFGNIWIAIGVYSLIAGNNIEKSVKL